MITLPTISVSISAPFNGITVNKIPFKALSIGLVSYTKTSVVYAGGGYYNGVATVSVNLLSAFDNYAGIQSNTATVVATATQPVDIYAGGGAFTASVSTSFSLVQG